jgi:16S rRNA (uracil1498-N3)-methyltransferase
MSMRLYVELPLVSGTDIELPPGAARHAQVRRVQPGDELRLFDGSGNDWQAQVLAVGRSSVQVRVGGPLPAAAELALDITVALGMPANDRMDNVVEKATELGVARIQPLHTERSVLRLHGERAERKRAHWQAIAEAACEQCGRARVPVVEPVRSLGDWLQLLAAAASRNQAGSDPGLRLLLSLQPDALPLPARTQALATRRLITLNGPEGGLTPDEEFAARQHGFLPTTMGSRVLRADTAPLAALAWLGLAGG